MHFPPSQPINSNELMLHLTCTLGARCHLPRGSPETDGGHRKRSLDIQKFPLFIFFPLFPPLSEEIDWKLAASQC